MECLSKVIHSLSESLVYFNNVILVPFFVFIVTFDVIILRYCLNKPLAWGSELQGYLLLLLFFLCMTKCEEDESHIRMEILFDHYSKRGKLFVDIISAIIGLVFFSVLSWQSFLMVPEMIEIGQTGLEFLWPLWPLRLAVALLSFLCAVRILLKIANKTSLFFRGE